MNQLYNLPGNTPERRANLPGKFSNFKKFFLMLAFLACALYSNAQLPTTGFQSAEGKSFSFPTSATTLRWGPNCATPPGTGNVPNSVGRTIINVRDFGANGSDQEDDTEAFRAVFSKAAIPIPGTDRHIQPSSAIFVYVPNGTYIFRDSIGFAPNVVKTNVTTGYGGNNIQMWGESRTGVILKLNNSATGFTDATRPKAFFNTGGGAP
ncbi:MAG TPA: glycosyl hydrolase family 28-related protein, partial [Cytophagaceae bacterium]